MLITLYRRSIAIIDECFEEFILKGQEILQDKKINSYLTGLIKAHYNHYSDIDIFITKNLGAILDNNRLDSVRKFGMVYSELANYEVKNKLRAGHRYTIAEMCLKEFKLNILYPRLDINVSKHINHLLKSPFCIHPKTGLISVPLSERDIVEFSLDKIPNLNEIIDDFRDNKKNGKFKHFLDNFEEFTRNFAFNNSGKL
jgi:DNA primase small subunit